MNDKNENPFSKELDPGQTAIGCLSWSAVIYDIFVFIIMDKIHTKIAYLIAAIIMTPFAAKFIATKIKPNWSAKKILGMQFLTSILVLILFSILFSGVNKKEQDISTPVLESKTEQITETIITTEPVTETIPSTEVETIPDTTKRLIETNTEPKIEILKEINGSGYCFYTKQADVSGINLDQALEKIKKIFPYHEIKEYYSFKESCCFKSKKEESAYLVTYCLTEYGKNVQAESDEQYPPSEFYVKIKTNSNSEVESISFFSYLDRREDPNLNIYYTKSDWYYDFMDYYSETQLNETDTLTDLEMMTELEIESITELEKETEHIVTSTWGEILEINEFDDTVVVKTKMQSSLTNKMTIDQNYYLIADLVKEEGFDKYNEIQYWAVADMMDGSESKFISFTVTKPVIDGIKAGTVVTNLMGNYVSDLWVLPSLRE